MTMKILTWGWGKTLYTLSFTFRPDREGRDPRHRDFGQASGTRRRAALGAVRHRPPGAVAASGGSRGTVVRTLHGCHERGGFSCLSRQRCAEPFRSGARGVNEDVCFAAVYPSLRRRASVVRPVDVDADDLVQEAVMSSARVEASGRVSTMSAGAHLRAAIINIARNQYRARDRRQRIAARQPRPVEGVADVYPSDLDELRRIKPEDRAILYLSLIEGHSYSEIGAATLGCSEDTARARASRAVRKLRFELREQLPLD